MFFSSRRKLKTSESTLVFCRSRIEASKAICLTGGSISLALSKSERFYKNEIPSDEGCLYGVVHQSGRFHRPFLPVEVKFSGNVSYTKTVKSGAGSACVTRLGSEGADDTFYKMEVWIEDPNLVIFEKIEKCMAVSAISGMQFFHLNAHFFELHAFDFKHHNEVIDAEHHRIENWSKSEEGDDFYYLETPIERLSFTQGVELKSPAWGAQWTEGALHRKVFHSKDTAMWRKYSK